MVDPLSFEHVQEIITQCITIPDGTGLEDSLQTALMFCLVLLNYVNLGYRGVVYHWGWRMVVGYIILFLFFLFCNRIGV